MHQPARLPQASAEDRGALRLEDRVYVQLLDAIRLGEFRLGQRLPSETDLATAYGCSRPVVRSALAKLRENGLIVSRQGAGSFVSAGQPDERTGYAPLESIDDIAGYFAFRTIIEAQIVARAAERARPRDIAALNALVAKMDEQADTGTATVETDIEFHLALARLSDNRFLLETVEMLRPHWLFIGKFVRSLGRTGYRIGKRDMNSEHRAIVAAVEAGDPEAARTAMIAHVEGSERRVFKGEG